MITYIGIHREPFGCHGERELYEVIVEREGQQSYHLNPRLDLVNHSPIGVCWGYEGSGPAQCAVGILADYLGDDKRALLLYQDFKREVIVRLDKDKGWELTDRQIEDALAYINARRMQTL
jgi:Family of unknown function (DUF6166)